MRTAFLVLGAVLAAVVLAAPSANAANQVSGAIFTTTADGTKVNGNIYADKNDVYLNGGPQSGCSQAGLPDGVYYYQVTDPSGKVMLSQDPIACRTAIVSNGYWTYGGGCETAGPSGTNCCHKAVSYAGSCPNQIQYQLMPYADTTNNGGEYKAWATPVAFFDFANYQKYCAGDVANGFACQEYSQAERAKGRSFGFVDSESKTDNYKVRVADIPPPPPASASSAPSPSSNPTKAPTRTPASTPEATKPPTRTPTSSSDPTKPATRTPAPTPDPTKPPTRSQTPTADPTKPPTRSQTPTSKATDAPTRTPTTSAQPSRSLSATPEGTPNPTFVPGPTGDPTPAATRPPTSTSTPTSAPTAEPTTTPAPTADPTSEPTRTPTSTADPTKAPTTSQTPTADPTKAPTTTPTPSADPTQAPTTTPVPTSNPTSAPTQTPAPTPDSTPAATPSAPPTECVNGGYSDNCGASSDCTRCASVSLVKREKLPTAGYAVTYKVCNRCDNNVGSISFGLEAPVNALGSVPAQITSANGDKYQAKVAAGNPKGGQEPTFRALELSSPKFDNKLRKGACDEFTFTINVWNPDWKQSFVVIAGQYMDFFANIPVGQCASDSCVGCEVSECPDGLSGPNCDQCEDSDDYTWWCAPTGRGDYQLTRVFGSTASLPGLKAGGVDADGYETTCVCDKIYKECCADCADCDDTTGLCQACANPASTLTDDAPVQCCQLPVGAVTPCGSNPCVGNSVCTGATDSFEGQCECVTFEDGSSYTGADCDTFVPPPTNQTQFCEDFDCDDCNSAFEAFGLACSFCGDECRPSAFCESEQTECSSGVVAFTPGYCPGDCGGPSRGTCNETSGLCICKGSNKGLNCGSKNGLNYAAIGGLAAGAVAGIVVASVFAAAVIVGIILFITSYGAVKALNATEFANTFMMDSAIYDGPAGNGMNAVYESPSNP